ncbi:hypothetical protein BGZ93_009129 [Podila epicladia]|nr:hypothetical protein BGZ93_009129 [Podila epicladia]
MSSANSVLCLRAIFIASTRPKPSRVSQRNIPRLGPSSRFKHTDASLSFNKVNITDISAKPTPKKPSDRPKQTHSAASVLPPHKPATSTPALSESKPTFGSDFDRRLQFLQGLQRRFESSSSTSRSPKTTKVQRRVLDKKYRHGFQRGDFMCPQCGSHNFRPPDHALIGPWTGVRNNQGTGDKLELKTLPGSAKGGVSATVSILPSHHSHSQSSTAHPRGALAHCFECGFESTYKDPTTSAIAESKSKNSNGPRTSQNRAEHDLRLSNPREYVCASCQTVNYSGRIHCVGCGILSPRIRDMVENGTRPSD